MVAIEIIRPGSASLILERLADWQAWVLRSLLGCDGQVRPTLSAISKNSDSGVMQLVRAG